MRTGQLVFDGLPLVETGSAEGDAAGFGLAAFAAEGLEVDEVGHFKNYFEIGPLELFKAMSIWSMTL